MLQADSGGSEDVAMKEFDASHDPLTSCIFCGGSYAPDSRNWWDDFTCIFCHDDPGRVEELEETHVHVEWMEEVLIVDCA